ncbi:uncharacterized protein LOC129596501 [Paramacrobiotus metropolitanus]|uniref:uncharacterized protein LOC129596501 n=1 Tax=Paramacrobiotus metropolitanus TaxID=2943436 RepID=UPI0024457304|nr:uncharacterized protein LOC129596501 [Paramacrobiotus metropolitanus]
MEASAIHVGILLVAIGCPSVFGVYYPTVDLQMWCGKNFTVSCPSTLNGRAGTLRLSPPPDYNCQVNFTLESNCGFSSDRYAIYFNIRKFDLPSSSGVNQDTMMIYEQQLPWPFTPTLVKQLSGYQTAMTNPASVAQLLSSYSRRPSLTIQYLRQATTAPVYGHELLIDYVIVEESSTVGNTYCSALYGYVNDDYICDHDGGNDRCNCPYTYTASLGSNPAYTRGSNCGTHGGSIGLIVGAIMGSIGFIIIIVVVVLLARRRHHRILVARTCVHEPTVVGPYQQMPSYQNAPPAYNQQCYTEPHCGDKFRIPQATTLNVSKFYCEYFSTQNALFFLHTWDKMDALRYVYVGILLAAATLTNVSAAYVYYSEINLDLPRRCGEQIVIPCPFDDAGRFGTLRWTPPSNSCTIHLALEDKCGFIFDSRGQKTDRYAIYLNFPKLESRHHVVEVYEDRNDVRTLVKHLIGGMAGFKNPRSVAQLLSLYSNQPSLTLQFSKPRNQTNVSMALRESIDFRIIEEFPSPDRTYCDALGGYLMDKYMCDHGGDGRDDRCNCPSNYVDSIARNPATGRQRCSSANTSWMIVGVVLGCVGAMIGVVVPLAILIRRRRAQNSLRATEAAKGIVGPYQSVPSYQESAST